MQFSLPNPKRSLVVILGASSFERAPSFAGGSAFLNSMQRVLSYLTDANGLGIDPSNVLQLFDDSRPPGSQLEDIADFLSARQASGTIFDGPPENLFVYYVGHGLFTTDRRYCLAVRRTQESNVGISAIRGHDLAEVIRGSAIHLRRFLILDCCFAASMYGEFLSAPVEAAATQILDELPESGTSLLCASSPQDVALAPKRLECTMFSDALIKALNTGSPALGPRMSLAELGSVIKNLLKRDCPSGWVRPEIHSPDMRAGDISALPLFPNPQWSPVGEEVENSSDSSQDEQESKSAGEQAAKRKALFARAALAVCGILITVAVFYLYWALMKSRRSLSQSSAHVPSSMPMQSASTLAAVSPRAPIPPIVENHARTTWRQQVSNTDEWLSSVAFPTSESGWAVGYGATILHTDDGGANWKRELNPAKANLSAVAFITPLSGWAVGENGTILHTEDGGATWKSQISHSNVALLTVAFATGQSGWVAGARGTILHTDDGGRTWNRQISGTDEELYSVGFATAQSVCVVGHGATILRTVDGGNMWKPRESHTDKSWSLSSVAFQTVQLGWIVGNNGTILKTEDGGDTWNRQISPSHKWLMSVAFSTAQRGWVVAQTAGGLGDTDILQTEDGGRTWSIQSQSHYVLNSLAFAGSQTGWAVGGEGSILHAESIN